MSINIFGNSLINSEKKMKLVCLYKNRTLELVNFEIINTNSELPSNLQSFNQNLISGSGFVEYGEFLSKSNDF